MCCWGLLASIQFWIESFGFSIEFGLDWWEIFYWIFGLKLLNWFIFVSYSCWDSNFQVGSWLPSNIFISKYFLQCNFQNIVVGIEFSIWICKIGLGEISEWLDLCSSFIKIWYVNCRELMFYIYASVYSFFLRFF